MAPIVKDVENSSLASAPTVPANPAAKTPQDTAARPQPIPLEVAVSVNGARTVEGTDKREPFSESTKTVLIFANGAVIRLASSVAPGQLLFVTNEKSKKEVVCQVVKSKNYRTVTGYVELEFTEPAVGFWGVRISNEQPAPSAAALKPPAAPRPVAPPVGVSPTVGSPKVATPVPPAPAAPKKITPAVVPEKSAVVPSAAAPVLLAKPEAVKPQVPASVSAPVEQKVSPAPVSHAPVQPVPPPQPSPTNLDALPAHLVAQLSTLVSTKPIDASPAGNIQSVAAEVAKSPAVHTSGDASTEELRQQATRLQEQLSSLLFRESAAKPATPPVAAVPAAPIKQATPAADAAPPVVQKPESKAKPASISNTEKTPTIPAPIGEFKSSPMISKPSSISLPEEEVKIPSWLAPLARETETAKETSSSSESISPSTSEVSSYSTADEKSSSVAEDTAQQLQTVVFGGQLLGGSASAETQVASSGSKKGLFLGLAATVVLAVGGGVWYGMQPGNFLGSKAAATFPVQNNIPASNIPAERSGAGLPTGAPLSSTQPSSAPSTAARPASTSPTSSIPPADANRVSNNASAPTTTTANASAQNAASMEQPKKPVLGDVHLATPTINHSADSGAGEAAPSIDAALPSNAGDPLVDLAASDSREPSAPLPIGGDVKPARLLKSMPPIYPPAAKTQRIAGDVKLDALIDATGSVTATKIISGPTLLHQAAIAAVKQWKYEPAFLDGKPTSMHLTVTVQFRLQ